jgi:GMP synthase (glutamine-hydrolysing)
MAIAGCVPTHRKILIVVHQSTSDPGLIGQILGAWGYALDIRVTSQQDELPTTLDNHDAVVIFGGPMSANDDETLPFIRTELNWIPVALESGKPFLGICLGAQLLARVLGAVVKPHLDGWVEIGYFRLMPTGIDSEHFAHPLNVYHWHREGFELPKGAVSLFEGEIFKNQAYRYGDRAYGLQFHPEMTRTMLEKWTTQGADMLTLPGAQSRDEQLYKHSLYAIAREHWLKGFLCHWLGKSSVQRACA